MGGNPEAARLTGIPVRRMTLVVYSSASLLAAMAGVVTPRASILHARTSPQQANWTAITRGHPRWGQHHRWSAAVLGAVLGAMIVAVLRNGLTLHGVSGLRADRRDRPDPARGPACTGPAGYELLGGQAQLVSEQLEHSGRRRRPRPSIRPERCWLTPAELPVPRSLASSDRAGFSGCHCDVAALTVNVMCSGGLDGGGIGGGRDVEGTV